jgi:glycosyltransferase involved in cell wall biosynthesis
MDHKKKILILNWRCPKNPLSGGAEMVTLEHAKAWVKNGYDVSWLAGGYKNSKNIETIEGVQLFRFGSPITIYFLAPFIYWFKWRGNFDLVLDEIHGVPFLSPLWAWKSKKIAYIHEVAQEIWDDMLPFPISILGKLYEKVYFFFYRNTPFLTGSNSTKQDLVRYGIEEKSITVIPHGLFLNPVTHVPKKENQLTLLFVGRLVKMKGIEDAIKIFAEIKKKEKEAMFWVVGGGEKNYVSKLHSIVKELGLVSSVIFFGYVDETKKIDLYQRAHFLLHTSVREGFGLVVIEANSQGTPVLAYDTPGLRDVVKHNVNGFIFPCGEFIEIANKCISLFKSQEYVNLAVSARQSSKEYNWNTITNHSLQLLLL